MVGLQVHACQQSQVSSARHRTSVSSSPSPWTGLEPKVSNICNWRFQIRSKSIAIESDNPPWVGWSDVSTVSLEFCLSLMSRHVPLTCNIVSICIYMYLPMLQHAQTTFNASTYPCTSLPAWFPQPTMKWIHQDDQWTSQVAHPEPRNSRRSTRIGQWMRVFGIPEFNKHPHTYIITFTSDSNK